LRGGEVGRVQAGRDLHDVERHHAQAFQAVQERRQLAECYAARLGTARARRVRRVEHVDIHRNVQRQVADALAHSCGQAQLGTAPGRVVPRSVPLVAVARSEPDLVPGFETEFRTQV